MLSGLRLGNFKAFAETQAVPIRPLTLIFGANSSGKSSLIHGLLFARHALETGELDTFRTLVGGESVDLGGFRQYIHRRELERRVEWGVDLEIAQMPSVLRELLHPAGILQVSLTIGYVRNSQQSLLSLDTGILALIACDIVADDALLLRMSRRSDGVLRIDRLESEHPIMREIIGAILEFRTTTSLTPRDYETVSASISELLPSLMVHTDRLLPARVLLPNSDNTLSGALLVPISKGDRAEDLTNAVRLFLPRELDRLLRNLNDALTNHLGRLRYLGPLRSYPPRSFALAQHYDPNWFAGGGYAWDVVLRNSDVREAINAWLGSERLQTRYELRVRRMVGVDQLDQAIYQGLERIDAVISNKEDGEEVAEEDVDTGMGESALMRNIDLAVDTLHDAIQTADVDLLPQLVIVDRRTQTVVSHRDIGIGVSQVLPVLVSAYAATESLIAIEQPEIHLHPALQAELGDVFIEAALGKRRNTFVLETHSEHLILRIMRRMRDTIRGTLPEGLPPVRPEDVAILYVQPRDTSAASVVFELALDPDGQLRDEWPGGFFEEGFHERFA